MRCHYEYIVERHRASKCLHFSFLPGGERFYQQRYESVCLVLSGLYFVLISIFSSLMDYFKHERTFLETKNSNILRTANCIDAIIEQSHFVNFLKFVYFFMVLISSCIVAKIVSKALQIFVL